MAVTAHEYLSGSELQRANIAADDAPRTLRAMLEEAHTPSTISASSPLILANIVPVAGPQTTLVYNLVSSAPAAAAPTFTNAQLNEIAFGSSNDSLATYYRNNSFNSVNITDKVIGTLVTTPSSVCDLNELIAPADQLASHQLAKRRVVPTSDLYVTAGMGAFMFLRGSELIWTAVSGNDDLNLPAAFLSGASIHYWHSGNAGTLLASDHPWGGALLDGQTFLSNDKSVVITQLSHDWSTVTLQIAADPSNILSGNPAIVNNASGALSVAPGSTQNSRKVVCPLLYVSPKQINIQVPPSLEPGAADFSVILNGAPVVEQPLAPISARSVGMYSVPNPLLPTFTTSCSSALLAPTVT